MSTVTDLLLTGGALYSPEATRFAVFAPAATSVQVHLLTVGGKTQDRISLDRSGSGRWSANVAGIEPGQRYLYGVDGPRDLANGYRFDPTRLLIDPYSLSVDGPQPDLRSVVIDRAFDWQGVGRPAIPAERSVIYETHVKGMTKLHPGVPAELRGTYAGMWHPAVIEHLIRLGVTSIELLPCAEFISEQFLLDAGLVNYWGYNPVAFFAPTGRYSDIGTGGGQVESFKTMVRELHRAGLEVIMDVVFNHTGEGNDKGPEVVFKGFDNPSYYRLDEQDKSQFIDFTGCGNTYDSSSTPAVELMLEAFRYWHLEMGVDGFRCDLATTIGRNPVQFTADAPIFSAIESDPSLRQAKFIAEPWDLGPNGYQVGNFPAGWSEWNDRFREPMRSYWLGGPVGLGEFARQISGSSDLYARSGRGPLASVNYVTAHDGFTLVDLVRNRAGESTSPDSIDQARRNLIASLLFSLGVPMLLGGDELGRSQHGIENGYDQDNESSWFHWDLDNAEQTFLDFVRNCIAVRAENELLRLPHYWTDASDQQSCTNQATWYSAASGALTSSDWRHDFPGGLSLVVEPSSDECESGNSSQAVLMMVNPTGREWHFTVPGTRFEEAGTWRSLIDTSSEDGLSDVTFIPGKTVNIPGPSMIVCAWNQNLG